MKRFTLPRDLYHGKGALEALKGFEGKRAMILSGGGSMRKSGFLDKAEKYLKEAGMEMCIRDRFDVAQIVADAKDKNAMISEIFIYSGETGKFIPFTSTKSLTHIYQYF